MDLWVTPMVRQKGRISMSGLKFQSRLIIAFASLLMSSIAVGSAITPTPLSATSVEVASYA